MFYKDNLTRLHFEQIKLLLDGKITMNGVNLGVIINIVFPLSHLPTDLLNDYLLIDGKQADSIE